MIALVFLLTIAIGVAAFLTVPRGTVRGRSALLPGQTLNFLKTGAIALLGFAAETTMQWRGRVWVFALVQLPNGTCRAYILSSPSYGDRSATLRDTHRLKDHFGRAYVCWVPEPAKPDQMASVLAMWVAATSRYIETGNFPAAHAAGKELSRDTGPGLLLRSRGSNTRGR
ncbi:MAG: hypothetical protein JWQ74_3426 [Marmoricola sp.]|nr:hypothetical protein [Marmoricola sp.]